MEAWLNVYFLQTGVGWAVIGGMVAVMLGGVGSAKGIAIAGAQAGGVLSEKPELFGKLLVMIALPGTQGFYALICAIMIALRIGLINGKVACTPVQGLSLMAVGICMGIVEWRSAISQGEASAAGIAMTAKKPEESGRAILLPALVETYAVVALLAAILLTIWITNPALTFADPAVKILPAAVGK
jgi:V/A-type H+-transporting ATPase subunit K